LTTCREGTRATDSNIQKAGRVIQQNGVATSPVAITHGADRCELLPRIGGSIGSWTVGEQPMLRAYRIADVVQRNPLGMASFPLVPYSNRIGNGEFRWDSKPVHLAKNFPPEPHAIHGVGFERPWSVESQEDATVVLSLTHHGDASWPWAFEARQRISIGERRLTLEMSATNLARHPAPLAFGHHPYFPVEGASLEFEAQSVWMVGDDALPTQPEVPAGPLDFSTAARVAERSVDHCYVGWKRPARIRWSGRPLALEIRASDNLSCAVVYISPGANGFCFEPVPHVSNALNLASRAPAMPIAGPGETFSARITLTAERM
jgi:aldose 1-epimerase